MRFLRFYLIGYFILLIGAVWSLWHGGVLEHLPLAWVLISLVVAIGFGIMLAISAEKAETTRE